MINDAVGEETRAIPARPVNFQIIPATDNTTNINGFFTALIWSCTTALLYEQDATKFCSAVPYVRDEQHLPRDLQIGLRLVSHLLLSGGNGFEAVRRGPGGEAITGELCGVDFSSPARGTLDRFLPRLLSSSKPTALSYGSAGGHPRRTGEKRESHRRTKNSQNEHGKKYMTNLFQHGSCLSLRVSDFARSTYRWSYSRMRMHVHDVCRGREVQDKLV